MLHHGFSYPLSLVLRVDHHILDDPGRRPLVPEVIVNGDMFAVTRPRPSYDAMIAAQNLPEWLG
jgi:hypothetical protein